MHPNVKKNNHRPSKKTKLDNGWNTKWYSLHWSQGTRIQGYHEKTLVESEKFRCQQQCLVKLQHVRAAGKPAAVLENTRQKYACIVEADESMTTRLEGVPHRYHEDPHCSKRDELTKSLQFGAPNLFRCSKQKKIPDSKVAVEKEWEKLEKMPAWQLTKVKNKSEVPK